MMMLAMLQSSPVLAEPPVAAQVEVNFLLGYVEGSGCAFNRNGSWYDSSQAQSHLRDKYRYLSARNQINTAEDFIERAASKSSFSGRDYTVKCGDGVTMPSGLWLNSELARLRTYE